MQTDATRTDPEQERLELERRKLELEERKFGHAQKMDEKKLESERTSKLWSQLSIFFPLVILLVGFFLNSSAEQHRRDLARQEEIVKGRRDFITEQLSKFYYPIQLRLHKDNAIFKTWNENRFSTTNRKLAKQIEETFVIPNHEEIIKIIDTHFDLIRNDSEYEEDLTPLMDALKAYERHVALYKALRDTGDSRKPIQLSEPFPKEFFRLIEQRIADLENQRDDVH
jgi:hypothetical protein